MEEQMNQNQPNASNQGANMAGNAPQSGGSDAEKNKLMGIVGYIIPILFFIPLFSDETKNSPFAKFHANQQLMLLIAAIAVNVVGGIIPFLGWFIILPLGSIFLIIVAIMGIINAAKGQMKKLPLIGGFEIIK